MILANVKMLLGGLLRKLIVYYYRFLGVDIGERVFISHCAKIDTTYPGTIHIKDDCYITYGACIISHDHTVYRRVPFSEDDGTGTVVLERNVFVGTGAIILRNVRIGENSIVSAGAVVTRDVPANTIVAGNPAQVIANFIPRTHVKP